MLSALRPRAPPTNARARHALKTDGVAGKFPALALAPVEVDRFGGRRPVAALRPFTGGLRVVDPLSPPRDTPGIIARPILNLVSVFHISNDAMQSSIDTDGCDFARPAQRIGAARDSFMI